MSNGTAIKLPRGRRGLKRKESPRKDHNINVRVTTPEMRQLTERFNARPPGITWSEFLRGLLLNGGAQ